MDASARAPGYDFFKLVVAILLLSLALILMWGTAPQVPPPGTVPASPTIILPTGTASPLPSATATTASTATAAPPSSPSATPVSEAATAPAGSAAALTPCQAAMSRSRLQAGMRATVLRRLNFRSSPGIQDNWVLTNLPGTQIEIIAGPECLPHSSSAYLWWQVRLPDGRTGWSAEASLHGSSYFLEPVE
ncbi:MAG TPA: SH3 domain-containing protein [Anaerolineales bacterium]|nr:SH3 domain-containing protein [Anaerolineales bacterium]